MIMCCIFMLDFTDFFPTDCNNQIINELGKNTKFVWEMLPKIFSFLEDKLEKTQLIKGSVMEGAYLGKNSLFIDTGSIIEPGAYIEGPTYIGMNVTIRHGSYIRANSIILDNCLIGNSTEVKNSILLPHAYAPHFNYIGDSILGSNVNLGAGTKLSNLTVSSMKDKVTGKRSTIKLVINGTKYDTGLSKMGAILGDNVQTGCNSVLNPGCMVRENTLIYPNVSLKKGYYQPNKIIKLNQQIEIVDKL